MQKRLALRAAKLSSEPQRVKYSNYLSIAYEHQPRDPEERHHGVLFGVISVNSEPKKSEELVELILDTFHGEFYQDLAKDPLESFENALSKINEELADYANAGNTFWMGKIQAVLGVFSNNFLHLTQSGKAEGYLHRSGKQSHLTQELTGDNLNPSRTFVNIASGQIEDGDKIALVTSGVLSSCSPDEIAKFVNSYHPKVAVNHIADIISGVGGSKGQNAAVVMEFMTPEALANETLEEEPEEIWLEGAGKKEMLAEGASTLFGKASQAFGKAAASSSGFYSEKLKPRVKVALQKDQTKPHHDTKPEKDIFVETEEELDLSENLNFEHHQQLSLEEAKKPEFKSEIRIKETDEFPKLAIIGRTRDKAVDKVNHLLDAVFKLNRKKKDFHLFKVKKVYLAIAAALLIAIVLPYGFYVKGAQKETATKNEQRQKIDSIATRVNETSTESDLKKAVEALESLRSEAEAMTSSKYFGDEAKKQVAAIDEKIDSMTKTNPVALETLAEFTELKSDIVSLSNIGLSYYAVSQDGGIYNVDLKNKKVTLLKTTGAIKGNVVSAATLERIRTIEMLTDENKIYEFDTETNSIEERSATDGWGTSKKVESYGTNLYLLTGEGNQINKFVRTSGGYARGVPYFANNDTQIETFTIDSDIYIVNSEGLVSKYTAGKKQDFEITDLPFSLTKTDIFYTNEDSENIFALSRKSKTITVFNKDGKYIGRLKNDEFADAKSLLVEDDTAYAIVKNKVVSFSVK